MSTKSREHPVALASMSAAARERLVACVAGREEPSPLLEAREGFVSAIAPSLAFAGLGIAFSAFHLASGFGVSPLTPFTSAAVVVGAAMAAAGALSIAARFRFERRALAPPGRYLFAAGLVDAREEDRIVVRSTEAIAEAHARGRDVDLRFQSGVCERFVAGDPKRASRVVRELLEERARLRAEGPESPAEPSSLSEIFSEPSTARAPWVLRHRTQLILVPVLALVIGAPLVVLRDRESDEEMFRRAVAKGTKQAFVDYLERGSRHASEVRETALPKAELAEERAARDAAFDAFAEQASTEDPRLLPFMKKLLAWLDRHGTSQLLVRFRSPSSASLAVVDALLADEHVSREGPVAKVAPHFDATHSRPREAAIVKALATSFQAVFPVAIAHVEEGPPIVDDAPPPEDAPTLDVAYRVGFSGDVYGEAKGDRKFVGIAMSFEVTFRIPGEATTLDLTLKVEPPDSFDVGGDEDSDGGIPTEGRVYDAMAARAFDRLDAALRQKLFKPGSPAFKQ